MHSTRITIAGGMGLVVAAGIGLAALRHPSYLAANVVFSLVLIVLAGSLLAVVVLRGSDRVGWIGFALFGWGYLGLTLGPGADTATAPHLATTTLIDLAYEHVYSTPYSWPELREIPAFPGTTDKFKLWDWPDHVLNKQLHNAAFRIMTPEPFFRIGHSLFALPFAVGGGWFARRLSRRAVDPGPAPADDTSPSSSRTTGHHDPA